MSDKLLEKEIYPIESVIGADDHSYGGKSGKIVGLMSDIVQLVAEMVANQQIETCNIICPKA